MTTPTDKATVALTLIVPWAVAEDPCVDRLWARLLTPQDKMTRRLRRKRVGMSMPEIIEGCVQAANYAACVDSTVNVLQMMAGESRRTERAQELG